MTQFKGCRQWLVIDLKKDRLKIITWLIFILGIFMAVAFKFESLYGTPHQIQTISEILKSPAMTALFGTVPSGKLTTANIFSAEMSIFWAILLIICNFSIAIGASRQPEEAGVTELLLGGYPIGRLAPLTAAALELTIVNGAFIVIGGFSLNLARMPGADINGNFLMVSVLGLVGWAFGMIALLFAQIAGDSHLASIYNYFCFGVFYILRMITDIQAPHYTWLSPLGWVEKTELYTRNNWLPVILALILGGLAFIGALKFTLLRDLNTGLIQSKQGPKSSAFLRGPIALLWQLQKTRTLVWLIGLTLLGLTYGAVFDSVGQLINTSPVIQKVLGDSGMHQLERTQLLSFLNILGLIFVVLAIVAGVMVLNHLFTDGSKGYLELVQTRAVGRYRLYLVYVLYGLILTSLIFFIALMAAMFAGNLVLARPLAFRYFSSVFMAIWPIALTFVGFNALLLGWWPKIRGLTWFYLALSFMITYFGKLLDLPTWGLKISPFYSIRQVPLQAADTRQIWLWFILAGILVILGLVGYRRRDLQIH